jgi:hypothetical protein
VICCHDLLPALVRIFGGEMKNARWFGGRFLTPNTSMTGSNN